MPAAIADFYTDLADRAFKVTHRGIPSALLNQYIATLAFGTAVPLLSTQW